MSIETNNPIITASESMREAKRPTDTPEAIRDMTATVLEGIAGELSRQDERFGEFEEGVVTMLERYRLAYEDLRVRLTSEYASLDDISQLLQFAYDLCEELSNQISDLAEEHADAEQQKELCDTERQRVTALARQANRELEAAQHHKTQHELEEEKVDNDAKDGDMAAVAHMMETAYSYGVPAPHPATQRFRAATKRENELAHQLYDLALQGEELGLKIERLSGELGAKLQELVQAKDQRSAAQNAFSSKTIEVQLLLDELRQLDLPLEFVSVEQRDSALAGKQRVIDAVEAQLQKLRMKLTKAEEDLAMSEQARRDAEGEEWLLRQTAVDSITAISRNGAEM